MTPSLHGPYGRFVAIGDSTTEGVGDPLPDGRLRGWADRLAEALARRQGGISYANLAIRGRRTAAIRAEQADAAVALQPDLVTAVVGVNDVVATQLDEAELDHEVDALYATLRRSGATVVGATLPDLSGLVPLPPRVRRALQRRSDAVNAILQTRAAEHGVVLLPLSDLPDAVNRRVWSPDRLHPNRVGHALLAQAMFQLVTGDPIAVTAGDQPGYGTTAYARDGALASLGWAGRYLIPRTVRRLRGISSGDGREAKLAAYLDLR